MMKYRLWSTVSDLFLTDDGSLPEINFACLTASEASAAYQLLRGLARGFGSSFYWSDSEKRDMLVEQCDRAEDILADAEGKFFHVILLEVRSPSGYLVPTLGVGVSEDSISIDFRMGMHWTPDAVYGFFEIASAIEDLTARSQMVHKENLNDPDGGRFSAAFHAFRHIRSAQ